MIFTAIVEGCWELVLVSLCKGIRGKWAIAAKEYEVIDVEAISIAFNLLIPQQLEPRKKNGYINYINIYKIYTLCVCIIYIYIINKHRTHTYIMHTETYILDVINHI